MEIVKFTSICILVLLEVLIGIVTLENKDCFQENITIGTIFLIILCIPISYIILN